MKIVFIGCKDIHKLGGIESYMSNLSAELIRRGHGPVIYCESNRNSVEYENGIKLIHYKAPKNIYLSKIWVGLKATIRTLVKEKGVSAIHYNSWPPAIWSFIPRIFGKKTFMQGHGLGWERSKYSAKKRRIIKLFATTVTRLSKYRIMCSEAQSEYFRTHYNLKCTTIPTAVNLPAETGCNEQETLKKYGLETKGYFLFMGRLVQEKNPDYLIEGFKAANHGDMKLVIAGSNDADPAYVEKLHKMTEGNENIIFTGAIYADEKDAILRNAYTFCLPSTIEGLSIVLLEAMSYKLPIIASDIVANKEVLNDDDAVWVKAENVEDLTKAIEYSVKNPDILESFRIKNFDRVKESYTWEKITTRYINFLHSIKVS